MSYISDFLNSYKLISRFIASIVRVSLGYGVLLNYKLIRSFFDLYTFIFLKTDGVNEDDKNQLAVIKQSFKLSGFLQSKFYFIRNFYQYCNKIELLNYLLFRLCIFLLIGYLCAIPFMYSVLLMSLSLITHKPFESGLIMHFIYCSVFNLNSVMFIYMSVWFYRITLFVGIVCLFLYLIAVFEVAMFNISTDLMFRDRIMVVSSVALINLILFLIPVAYFQLSYIMYFLFHSWLASVIIIFGILAFVVFVVTNILVWYFDDSKYFFIYVSFLPYVTSLSFIGIILICLEVILAVIPLSFFFKLLHGFLTSIDTALYPSLFNLEDIINIEYLFFALIGIFLANQFAVWYFGMAINFVVINFLVMFLLVIEVFCGDFKLFKNYFSSISNKKSLQQHLGISKESLSIVTPEIKNLLGETAPPEMLVELELMHPFEDKTVTPLC